MKPALMIGFLLTVAVFAQESTPQASMKQLMLDLIHPAANDILLFVNRGGSKDDADWAVIRRSALTLAESGTLLTGRGRARDQGDWAKDARALSDAGAAAYKAAQAKDLAALASSDAIRWMRPAPPATNNTGRMCSLGTCSLGKEGRNELFAQKFPEGRGIGRRPDRGGRRNRLPRIRRSGTSLGDDP